MMAVFLNIVDVLSFNKRMIIEMKAGVHVTL